MSKTSETLIFIEIQSNFFTHTVVKKMLILWKILFFHICCVKFQCGKGKKCLKFLYIIYYVADLIIKG